MFQLCICSSSSFYVVDVSTDVTMLCLSLSYFVVVTMPLLL